MTRRVTVVVGLIAARLLAVIGLRPYLYVDSAEYEVLDFSGRWRRPWATPLLYQLTPGGHQRELLVQAVVGGMAWGVLALVVSTWFDDRRVGIGAATVVALLGLTTSVTNWDTAILSESLALSLTVLLIAAWLHLVRTRPPYGELLVLTATLPWLFVRQSLLPTAAMVLASVVVAAVVSWRRGRPWQHLAVVAAGSVLLVGLAVGSYARNQEIGRTNLTAIVAERVATDPGRLAWFDDHGMPIPPDGDLSFTSLDSDAAFRDWRAGPGRSTYARYLVTHPWYSLTEPLDDLVSVRRSYGDEPAPEVVMLSPPDGYGAARQIIPEPVEQILFDPGSAGTVLSLLAAVGVASLIRRRDRDGRWMLALGTMAISVLSMIVGWHGAAPELNRLALVAAVSLRIGLVLQGALLVEGWLESRSYPRTG